jgi:hypothetical protein
LLNVLHVGEDFAIGGLELVGAGSEHLRDDVWSFPWWGELVAVLVALDEAEHVAPGCLLEGGPTKLSPQTANGHVMGIIWSA